MSLKHRLAQLERALQARGAPDALGQYEALVAEAIASDDPDALDRLPPAPPGWTAHLEQLLREAAAMADADVTAAPEPAA